MIPEELRFDRPGDLREILRLTARAVSSGAITASVGTTIGQLVGVALRTVEVELSDAVRRLEDEVRARREQRGR